MSENAAVHNQPALGLMGRMLRFISRALDRCVVGIESRLKGGRAHISRRLEIPEYNTPELLAEPSRFYDLGLEVPEVDLVRRQKVMGIRVSHFSFDSEVKTRFPENDRVCGRVFEARGLSGGKNAPCMIIMHGWRESGAFAPYYYALGLILARAGINCVFMNLPYHGKRTPIGSITGDLMLCADLEQSVMAFRQAVCDGRSMISWLNTHFRGPIGVMGISLGGFISLVLSCVDDRLDFAIPVISSGSIIRNMWKTDVAQSLVRDFQKVGLDEAKVEENWKIICPIYLKSLLPTNKILPIAGRFDLLIPPENVEELKKVWNLPVVKWHLCGHISIFLFYRRIVRQIAMFVHEIRFL